MITDEEYNKAKLKIVELEKESQAQRKIVFQYEQEQKRVAFEQSKRDIENKYQVFWRQFYELAYRAIQSRCGSPEEFMQAYNYQEHKLKSLLRFQITSGEELLKFINDCGLRIDISSSLKNSYFPNIGVSDDYPDKVRLFKKYLNEMFHSIYSKSPQYYYEDLTGYEPGKLKRLFNFDMKSERELITLLHAFGFKMEVYFKADVVELYL